MNRLRGGIPICAASTAAQPQNLGWMLTGPYRPPFCEPLLMPVVHLPSRPEPITVAATWLDAEAVKKLLGWSESTLYRRERNSQFPRSIRLGARRVWALSDLDQFAERHGLTLSYGGMRHSPD